MTRWLRWFRRPDRRLDVSALAIRHHIRGHQSEALLCAECVADTREDDRD